MEDDDKGVAVTVLDGELEEVIAQSGIPAKGLHHKMMRVTDKVTKRHSIDIATGPEISHAQTMLTRQLLNLTISHSDRRDCCTAVITNQGKLLSCWNPEKHNCLKMTEW